MDPAVEPAPDAAAAAAARRRAVLKPGQARACPHSARVAAA